MGACCARGPTRMQRLAAVPEADMEKVSKILMIGDEVRCPLHHASFSLRTGAVLCPPAFDPIPCWRIERIGARVFLRDKLPAHVRVLQRRLQ